MKLLTYNFLTSTAIKGVKVGYPLILHVSLLLYHLSFVFFLFCCFVHDIPCADINNCLYFVYFMNLFAMHRLCQNKKLKPISMPNF